MIVTRKVLVLDCMQVTLLEVMTLPILVALVTPKMGMIHLLLDFHESQIEILNHKALLDKTLPLVELLAS